MLRQVPSEATGHYGNGTLPDLPGIGFEGKAGLRRVMQAVSG